MGIPGSHGSQKRALPQSAQEQQLLLTDEPSLQLSLRILENIPAEMLVTSFLQEASQFSLLYCTLQLESSEKLL